MLSVSDQYMCEFSHYIRRILIVLLLAAFAIAFLALIMEAVRTSETQIYFNDTTRRCIPQGYYLQ
jgi:hypothetical protein